jgi:hypothetical protein
MINRVLINRTEQKEKLINHAIADEMIALYARIALEIDLLYSDNRKFNQFKSIYTWIFFMQQISLN